MDRRMLDGWLVCWLAARSVGCACLRMWLMLCVSASAAAAVSVVVVPLLAKIFFLMVVVMAVFHVVHDGGVFNG